MTTDLEKEDEKDVAEEGQGKTTKLEAEVRRLRAQLDDLTERVRLDAVAAAFLRGDRGESAVRDGDYVLIDGFPTRVSIAADGIGKWTYFNGHNHVEPFRVPPSDDVQRLYTAAEVAEILGKEGIERRALAEPMMRHVDFLQETQVSMVNRTVQILTDRIHQLQEENQALREVQMCAVAASAIESEQPA